MGNKDTGLVDVNPYPQTKLYPDFDLTTVKAEEETTNLAVPKIAEQEINTVSSKDEDLYEEAENISTYVPSIEGIETTFSPKSVEIIDITDYSTYDETTTAYETLYIGNENQKTTTSTDTEIVDEDATATFYELEIASI